VRPLAQCSRAYRRGFSAAEILVAMMIGAVLATIAYNLLDVSAQAARRVDFRLGLAQDLEPALDRVERQLDYMIPYGVSGLDYSKEVFEKDRVRFFSSRDLRSGGPPRLVELRLQAPAAEAEGQPIIPGDVGAILLVNVFDKEGVFQYSDEPAGYRFLKNRGVSLSFERLETATLPEPPRIAPLAGIRGDRPAGLTATLRVEPSTGLRAGDAGPIEVQSVWLARPGMESAP
jgi:prepilin-type N-terminal cleavage/methylation domain-containing protein